MRFLSEMAVFDRIKTIQTVATGAITSDTVDMADFDCILFLVIWGAITDGTPAVKVRSGALSNMGDAADLVVSSVSITVDDDNKMAIVDVQGIAERYVDCVVTRGGSTGAVVDAILAIKYHSKKEPVTQSADVAGHEKHVAPAEGTA